MIRLPRAVSHCPACRQLASAASASASTSAAFASSSSTLSSRPRLAAQARTAPWARGVATEAVQMEQEVEDLEQHQPTESERDVEAMLNGLAEQSQARSESEEMDALLASLEESHVAPHSASFAAFAEPLPEPQLDVPPPLPTLSPSTLLAPSFPSGPPSPSDLDALAPRPFHTPDASSPDSHRLIYSRLWSSTFTRLEKAFTKSQLSSLVHLSEEDGGLGLDFADPRWKQNQKSAMKGGGKHWKPKEKGKMSKKELVTAVMVLRWGMTNPDVLPSGRKGPQKVDAVALTDRTLFLLLSPNSTTIPLLTRQWGLTYSFARNAETGVLSLVLRGNVKSVEMGRREVEGVADAAHTRLLRLPAPASTLRPEIYQSISRMAKAFLEPASSEQGDDVLRATATEERYLERLERYLLAAFSHDATRRALPHFIALPTAISSTSYSFLPFAPPFRTPFITGGSTSSYARIKSVGLAADLSEAGISSGAEAKSPFEELLSWSGKMGIEPLARMSLGSLASPVTASSVDRAAGILSTLRESLSASAAEADGTIEYELTGSFGHVLWPLYSSGEGRLGPALEGEWGVQQLLDWRSEGQGKDARTVWVSSPPTNFLPSTGVLTPTSPPSILDPLSPFASLTTLTSTTPPSEIVASGSKLDNDGFRRVVYRPVEVGEGGAEQRVEIEFEGGFRVKSRKMVEERAVEVLVPTGSTDFKITLTKRRELEESAVLDFPEAARDAPTQIFIESQPYLLDADRWIRRTTIDAPSPSAPFADSPVSQLAAGFSTTSSPPSPSSLFSRQVQETFHDRTIEGSRGVSVSVQLASPSRLGGDANRVLEQMQSSGAWKRALESMERKACETPEGSRLKGAGDVSQRVFSVGR